MAKKKPAPGKQNSEVESKVLEHFRRYLMTPGQMLCFSGQEMESMRAGLDKLVQRQMLVPEGSHGGFSLTQAGFELMKVTRPAS